MHSLLGASVSVVVAVDGIGVIGKCWLVLLGVNVNVKVLVAPGCVYASKRERMLRVSIVV